MGFFSFNKRIKHRTFDYTPRYYDPQKEELKERLAQYENDGEGINLEKTKQRIQSGLKSKYRADAGFKKSQTKNSNVRLILIILALFLISILFLRSDGLIKILENF